MEAKIETNEKGLEIEVTDVEGKVDKLVEAFQECSEGHCTCPTEEYKKVEKLEITESDDAIKLSITSKEDQHIEVSEIEKCLEYTRKKVSE